MLSAIASCDGFSVDTKKTDSQDIASSLPSDMVFQNQGRCRHVVDGDSLYIEGQKTQIRLWGVDAPEREEAGYQQAKDALKQLALNNEVHCATQDIDKYDRIVARCYLSGGEEINRALLEQGVAKEYCRFTENHYGFCRY